MNLLRHKIKFLDWVLILRIKEVKKDNKNLHKDKLSPDSTKYKVYIWITNKIN